VAFPYTVGNGDLFGATFTRRVGWGTESFAGGGAGVGATNGKLASNGYGHHGNGYHNGVDGVNGHHANGVNGVNGVNGEYAHPNGDQMV
jgi:diacylglycerol diphosphate phosphatase/phosphatidate phosphatase